MHAHILLRHNYKYEQFLSKIKRTVAFTVTWSQHIEYNLQEVGKDP